jgi:hypothetical protein
MDYSSNKKKHVASVCSVTFEILQSTISYDLTQKNTQKYKRKTPDTKFNLFSFLYAFF